MGQRGDQCPIRFPNEVVRAGEARRIARDAIVETEHPVLGRVRQVATPLRIEGYAPPAERGPFRGEHTGSVLAEVCGYTPDRMQELAAAGVFGAKEDT